MSTKEKREPKKEKNVEKVYKYIDGPVRLVEYQFELGPKQEHMHVYVCGDIHQYLREETNPCPDPSIRITDFITLVLQQNPDKLIDIFLEEQFISHGETRGRRHKTNYIEELRLAFIDCLQPSKVKCPYDAKHARFHYVDIRQEPDSYLADMEQSRRAYFERLKWSDKRAEAKRTFDFMTKLMQRAFPFREMMMGEAVDLAKLPSDLRTEMEDEAKDDEDEDTGEGDVEIDEDEYEEELAKRRKEYRFGFVPGRAGLRLFKQWDAVRSKFPSMAIAIWRFCQKEIDAQLKEFKKLQEEVLSIVAEMEKKREKKDTNPWEHVTRMISLMEECVLFYSAGFMDFYTLCRLFRYPSHNAILYAGDYHALQICKFIEQTLKVQPIAHSETPSVMQRVFTPNKGFSIRHLPLIENTVVQCVPLSPFRQPFFHYRAMGVPFIFPDG